MTDDKYALVGKPDGKRLLGKPRLRRKNACILQK
jgi:hypothetical protein